MAKAEQPIQSDTNAKINEAEVCFSMGLFDEALAIFSQILKDFPDLDEESKQNINTKIEKIKKQLEDQATDEAGSVSTEEISMLKKSLSGQEDAPAILDSASAFKDLGLYEEALAEFEKILVLDFPPEKVIPDIVDCLLKLFSPNDLFDKTLKIVGDQRMEPQKRGSVKYHFGLEMEKRDYRDLALDLYE